MMTAIWHWQGRGLTLYPTPLLKGKELDIYVWLVTRELFPGFVCAPAAVIASDFNYSESAVRRGLAHLVRRGLLATEKHHRTNYYRPLIWQKPRGYV